jgi:O-antigen ligase
MLDSPSLLSYPFVFRIGLLVVLVFTTVRCSMRGIQNGILIGLISGMSPVAIWLFKGSELLPGLPNVISLDRIVWPTVLAVFLVNRSRGETKKLSPDWIEWGLLAFIFVMLASMINHGSYTDPEGEWSLTKIMRGYAFPFMAYFIVRRGVQTTKEVSAFLVGLGFIALYLALTGIAELLNINELIFPQFILNPDLGIHFGRVRGIFLNSGAYGFALATALPFLVWLYFTDITPRRYLWPVVAVFAAVPLVFTFQRAAWLSAILTLGVTALAWPKRRAVLIGVLVFAGLCGLLFASEVLMRRLETRLEDKNTIDYRLAHIERGWSMFRANPVLGVGINRYGAEVEKYSSYRSRLTSHAHNTWITLLAELGLVGFLSYLIPFGFVLLKSVQLYWRFPQYRAIVGIVVGVTLAFIAMSMSLEIRGHLYANVLLLTIWSMTFGRFIPLKKLPAFQRTNMLESVPRKRRSDIELFTLTLHR